MSTTREDGLKVVLPNTGLEEFWRRLDEDYARQNPRLWKNLAMLALRDVCEWRLGMIERAFATSRGQIVRALDSVKSDVRARFPELAELYVGPSSIWTGETHD